MSEHRDPELEEIFDRDPSLERYARLLRSGRLRPPPLDPGFRHALRRELMTEAYDRYHRASRPGIFSGLFSGPRLAAAAALAGVVLIGLLLFANTNPFAPGAVQVTSVGSVAVNEPILVSFSQPMDHQSVEQSIQIEPATQVTYSWQGNNLVIQPVSGELAPNTQYHVTVSAAARTQPGTPIGKPATLAISTAPAPAPTPNPTPSPTAPPAPQITAERSLSGSADRVIGWSADGKTLFIMASGELDAIGADGPVQKRIARGVKLASLSPDGTALAYATADKVFLAPVDGSAGQQVDDRAAAALGWRSDKPLLLVGSEIAPAGGPAIAKLPASIPAAGFFSPDGSRLISESLAQVNATSPTVATTMLFDIGTQKATSWADPIRSGVAWSPDSSRVAFSRAGSFFVSLPDGGGAVEVARGDFGSASWAPDLKHLLLAPGAGLSIVQPDGGELHQLSQAAFQDIVWSPDGAHLAFARASSPWIDDISAAGGSTLDLGAAAAVVDQYFKARVGNDPGTAGGLLAPTATPVAPSPPGADLRLKRYFVISSQATGADARFTVRLIFSRGPNEVRYLDEALVLVTSGSSLKIASITDGAPHDLGKGPTVNSVQVHPDGLVLVFDSDLDPPTLGGSVQLNGPDGHPVKVTTAYSHRQLTLGAALTSGAHYHLVLSGNVQDIAGQQLEGGYEYDFVAPGPQPSPAA